MHLGRCAVYWMRSGEPWEMHRQGAFLKLAACSRENHLKYISLAAPSHQLENTDFTGETANKPGTKVDQKSYKLLFVNCRTLRPQ